MEKPDVPALAGKMIEAVRAYVAKSEAAMVARIASAEAAIAAIPAARNGKDADPAVIEQAVKAAVAALPKPADGRSVTVEDVAPLIASEAQKAAAALPKAKDGTSVTAEDMRPMLSELVGKAVAALPKAKDGENVHPHTVAVMVREAVDKAIAALPRPKDGEPGRDAAELKVLPGIDEARSYPAGTYAKHNGGEIRAERRTDPVKDGDLLAAGWTVAREGIAGVVFTQDEDPRKIECAAMLTSGAKVVSVFRMPAMIYREVWREGEFDKGDVVTWGGSAWHCQQKTTDKPGTSAAWKMMVKEGRPGKDAEPRAAAPREPVRLR